MTTSKTVRQQQQKIQPFEWLTSPESIGGFVREHVLMERKGFGDGTGDCDPHCLMPRAMHIGCGSSTVGEYLVRELGFEHVVNVDRDGETLRAMAGRWDELTATTAVHGDGLPHKAPSKILAPASRLSSEPQYGSSGEKRGMEFWCLDYTSERLPEDYADYFDLVVDKSTLDCTLCSDATSTASFLTEIYRTLKAHRGVYLVVSFHEIDLILPLLRDLPGADWTVDHTTMERQVECVVSNARGGSTRGKAPTEFQTTQKETEGTTSSRKPLNVLIARRFTSCQNSLSELELEAVVRHVQDVNDRWFREEQPLLTEERIAGLKTAFSEPAEKKMEGASSRVRMLSLRDAYNVVFTDAEREHLTYEHFLEDWEAFCEEGGRSHGEGGNGQGNGRSRSIDSSQGMTYDMALKFLEANQ